MMRLGVFGLGRSGLAVARAARDRGMRPIVYDQKSRDEIAKPDALDTAEAEGIDVRLGWDGRLDDVDQIVVNPSIPRRHPVLVAARVEVLSEVEFAYRISRAPIVGITGTNGKSTATVMTWLALREARVDAVLCGNIYGSGYPETTLTDAAASSTADQILVAEVSSFQLEWVSEFRPIAAAITNITSDHLDRYDGDREQYAATKRRIFDAQRAKDFAIVGADAPRPSRPTVLTFGTAQDADAFVGDRSLCVGEIEWEFPFAEIHNRTNAATAALAAYGALAASGRTDEFDPRILDGLGKFRGLAHRMQLVGERAGVRVINNSMCTNPDAVIRSIASTGAVVHALIGGVDKGLDFAPVGDFIEANGHAAYLFGRDADKILGAMGHRGEKFQTMAEAFDAAVRRARAGEVVMLSPGCASMDQFRDFVDRGNVFTAIAKEWLRE